MFAAGDIVVVVRDPLLHGEGRVRCRLDNDKLLVEFQPDQRAAEWTPPSVDVYDEIELEHAGRFKAGGGQSFTEQDFDRLLAA